MRSGVVRLPLPPDAFAFVMATGIVSIAALDHRYRWVSDGLAAVAVAGWAALVTLVLVNVLARRRCPYPLTDPDVTVRLFTFVAACTVLAARFQDYPLVLGVLTALACLAWLVLAVGAVRSMRPRKVIELRDRAGGVWELPSVATSGLVIVTAQLAFASRDTVLLGVGIALWLLAIGLYAAATWLILWRVLSAPDADIWRPDSWILMGGLAIGTLAGDRLHRAGLALVTHDWLLTTLRSVTVVTWVVATLWIPVLLYSTVRHFDPRYAGSGWATVFPLGMYSAATFAMMVETGWLPFEWVSRVFFWIASAVWLLVAAAAVRPMWTRVPPRHG